MVRRVKIKDLVLCALFLGLIILGAYIRIPFPYVPLTLQSFFVILPSLLGKRYGVISVSAYILLGLLGLPVFAGGGGLGYIVQPTFGYIIGFLAASILCSFAVGRKNIPSAKRLVLSALLGELVIYVIGSVWVLVISNMLIGQPIGVVPWLIYSVLTTLPFDIALALLAAYTVKRIYPIFRKQFDA